MAAGMRFVVNRKNDEYKGVQRRRGIFAAFKKKLEASATLFTFLPSVPFFFFRGGRSPMSCSSLEFPAFRLPRGLPDNPMGDPADGC